MSYARSPAILALLLVSILAGCGGGGGGNGVATNAQAGTNSNAPLTSIEELGLIINIPYEAEDAAWKEDKPHKKLTAVLRFDAQDTAKIVAEAERVRPPQPVMIGVEAWYPSDLTALSDERGVDEIPGKAYAADQFFQGDYMSGRLIRIDGNDYFVLELTGK